MTEGMFSNVKYLSINKQDEDWGLTVTTAGFQSIGPHAAYPPVGHPSRYWFNPATGRVLPEYQIIYVTAGEGVFQQRAGKVPLGPGSLLLVFPGVWHSYKPRPDTGWDTYWIGFYGAFPDHLATKLFFTPGHPVLDIGLSAELVALVTTAIELAKQQKTGYQQALSGVAMHVLGMAYYMMKNALFEDKEITSKIEKACMIMQEHPGGEVCLQDIAVSLNMSYSWFRKTFRRYTGLSPAQYQLQIKLQKAKALLVSSSRSVKEIAYLLDFESPNYFASFFKEKTGLSPLAFRKTSHGKPSG
jgi:AraC-like DNA-binding protein